ncbi:ABC transporter substrate-binding protein [Natrarchaeobius chitinivorans]|nr:ABC transporter substrate-binding protein [Natrarchaeobius chitinivorans]
MRFTRSTGSNRNEKRAKAISRRRFVQATGVAGAVGIAGCSDFDENGEAGAPDQGGNGGGDDEDLFGISGWVGTADPMNLQFNPYNIETFHGLGIFEDFAAFETRRFIDDGVESWMPRAIGDWTIDEPVEGATVTVTPPTDRTWHDGDAITSEDIYTKLRLDMAFGNAIDQYIDSIEDTGDAVEFTLSQDVNPSVFTHELTAINLDTKRDIYAEWLEQVEDATTEDEINEIVGDLAGWNLEEPVGTSPYALEERSQQEFIYRPHDGHPLADEIDIDGLQVLPHADQGASWQSALSERVDMMAGGTPQETAEEILETDTFDKMFQNIFLIHLAVTFNYDHEVWRDPPVRRAIAYALDRDAATQAGGYVEGEWGRLREPQQDLHGINIGVEAFLDDEFIGTLTDYGYDEQRTDEAAAELESAGYERDSNDMWVDSSGEPLSMDFKVISSFSEFVRAGQSIEEQLTDFGIDVEVITQESTTFFDDLWDGDYDVGTGYWGGGMTPYVMYQKPFYDAPRDFQTTNHPDTVDVPMPVGETSGDVESIDVIDRLDELSTAGDDERVQEITRELAWVYNQTVPQIPIWSRYGQAFINTSDWEWLDLEAYDQKMETAHEELFLRGWPRGRL